MEMDFVGSFVLEYSWMADFSRIIDLGESKAGQISDCLRITHKPIFCYTITYLRVLEHEGTMFALIVPKDVPVRNHCGYFELLFFHIKVQNVDKNRHKCFTCLIACV